jgi:hypothetical protein
VTEEERERVIWIEGRAAGATPGPWERGLSTKLAGVVRMCDSVFTKADVRGRGKKIAFCTGAQPQTFSDATFVAHAREDVPWLIELVKRLEDENRQLRSSVTGGK